MRSEKIKANGGLLVLPEMVMPKDACYKKGKGSGEGIPIRPSIPTDCQVPKVQGSGSQDCKGNFVKKVGC